MDFSSWALLIIPSANANSFPAILASFFVVALGFSLQQTAAQPFAIALGDPSTGSHRLNLGGSVNSFGTTLGPIIVVFFLFGSIANQSKRSYSNKHQYLIPDRCRCVCGGGYVFYLFKIAVRKK